ncbi:MAG: anaerobic ribonucleoside-triphosphate reductase [Candidatus Altarchaeum sp.]|nr:anaerobic ribonucleoside-triphosphate reductase [Candidatus Altarchaeum sp.]
MTRQVFVRKSDKTEKFNDDKIINSLLNIGLPASLAVSTANEIFKEIKNNGTDTKIEISSKEIKAKVYEKLKDTDNKLADKYIQGNTTKIRTSLSTFEDFDANKITRSLIEETDIDEKIAERISKTVKKQIEKLNPEFVTAPLIREMVCVELLKGGFENERKLYTRLGMPVYDVTFLIEHGSKENANLQFNPETIHKLMADQISKEYSLIKVLPLESADAHMMGEIHIHDLDYFALRPFCFSHDIRFFLKHGLKVDGVGNHTAVAGPAKKPDVAFLHAAKVLASAQVNCAGGQGFSYFNTFLAPYIRGLPYEKVKQLAQMFIYEMSMMYVARGGQSIHYDDFIWIKKDRKLKSVKIGEFVDKVLKSGNSVKNDGMEILRLKDDIKTVSLDLKTMKFKEFNITAVSRHKPKKDILYKIKTKSGKSVRVTDFHSIYTLKDKVIKKIKASELKDGDFVITPKGFDLKEEISEIDLIKELKKNAPEEILKNIYVKDNDIKIPFTEFLGRSNGKYIGFGNSKSAIRSLEMPAIIRLDDDILTLLGLFIGNGSFKDFSSKDVYIFLSIPESDGLDSFISKAVNKLGYNNLKRIDTVDLSFGSTILKFVFQYVLNTDRTSEDRSVPQIIFSLSKKQIMVFLKGLYSSDGWISKSNENTVRIGYNAINEKLAHDLSFLLSKIGIIVDVHLKNRTNKNIIIKRIPVRKVQMIYDLQINSYEQKRIFAKSIGFLQKEKQNLVNEILTNEKLGKISKQHHTRRLPKDLIYATFRDLNVRVPESIRTSKNLYAWNVERELAKIAHNTPASVTFVEDLIESHISLDEIVSIEKIKASEYVYDLEVNPNGEHIENFLGGFGSILVSNTVFSSIDCDIEVPEQFKDIPAVLPGGIVKENITYADFEDETKTLFNAIVDVYIDGDYTGKAFNFPKFEVQIYPKKTNKNEDMLLKVSELAAKFGTPYYIINQPYMPLYACYQSLPYDEKILILKDNKVQNIKIGEYIDQIMKTTNPKKDRGFEGEVEVADCHDSAISFDSETLKIEKARIQKVTRHKTKEKIFKLTLDGNRTFSGTEKHKIPLLKNGKIIETRVEEVKIGDYLIGVKNIPIEFNFNKVVEFNGKKIEIDGDFARLLGYFASKGYIHKANKITRYNKISFSFNINEKEYIKDVTVILKNKFRLSAKYDISEKNKTNTVYIYSKEFVELFKKIFTKYDTYTKRVPETIINAPKDIIKQFLVGLFRGNGYNADKIDLHLCNKELIEDVFFLTLRIGVPFNKYYEKDSYSLRITSNIVKKAFLDIVSFDNKIPVVLDKSFDFYEKIPVTPFNITRDNLKTGHWNRSQIVKKITESRIKKDNNLYSKFLKSDLHLFEVKKIEEVKSEYVYDLINVGANYNFLTLEGIFSSNCCAFLMPLSNANTEDDVRDGTVRGGALQVVTINLPQIAYESNRDENKFIEILKDRIEKAKRVHILKLEIIKKNQNLGMLPFMSQIVNEKGDKYLEPDRQSFVMGLIGMNECVKFMTGYELHEDTGWKFGLNVINAMKGIVANIRKETGLNFSLARTPAESSTYRLAQIDSKRFLDKIITNGEGKEAYYTNSFHTRPSADIPLWKRLSVEGSFHPLTDGGAMSHIWLGEQNPDPEAILSLTKKIATKTAIQYMAFTKDLTVCSNCNFVTGGLHNKCPSCNSENVEWWSRITGYYQNIKGWNKGKLKELQDRRRYGVGDKNINTGKEISFTMKEGVYESRFEKLKEKLKYDTSLDF